MTHIATSPACKSVNRLSLSKKRMKGVGRHGSSADKIRRYTSKGVGDLWTNENGKCTRIIILHVIWVFFCVCYTWHARYIYIIQKAWSFSQAHCYMEWVNNIKILKFKWCMIQLDRQIIFPVGEVKAREEVKLSKRRIISL